MSSRIPPSVKVCSTCEFWAGSRAPDPFNRNVVVETTAKGRCVGPLKGPALHSYNYSCSHFRSWGVLR